MTDMKRVTISFTDDLAESIDCLRQTEQFKRASYSKIVRYLVERGLASEARKSDSGMSAQA